VGTLEEKVLCLQRFEISVANAVINAEDSSLKTMNTNQCVICSHAPQEK